MSSHELGKATGAAVSFAAAAASWVENIEAFLRVAGSFVALISGCVVIYFAVLDRIEKRKEQKSKK